MLEILHKGSKACYIDEHGRDHSIPIFSVGKYIAEERYVVKVEGLEDCFEDIIKKLGIKDNHSIHCYVSPPFGVSFPEHSDPIDVFIYVMQGTKTMMVEEELFIIDEGHHIHIPAGTPHRATNTEPSIMLSIGIE